MKLAIELGHTLVASRTNCHKAATEFALKARNQGLSCTARRRSGGSAFDDRACEVNVRKVNNRGRVHPKAARGPLDGLFSNQPPDRLANRGPADAKLRRELIFSEQMPGLKLTRIDHPPKPLVYDVGQ